MTATVGAQYSRPTSSELDVVLRGAASTLPADRVLVQLQGLVEVMGLLEDAAVRRDRAPWERSTWSFGELGLGSVHARLRPLDRAASTPEASLDRVPLSVVQGFHHAEESADLPTGWGEDLAAAGGRVAERLSSGTDGAMTLTLIEDGRAVWRVDITNRAATNLRAAVNIKRRSVGSVIGVLASVNTRRWRVGLWTELDDRRLPVSINREQLETVRANLDRRVLIGGELTRNAVGQVLAVRADEIPPWPKTKRRLSETGGLANGFLGNESSVEHLERVGGRPAP